MAHWRRRFLFLVQMCFHRQAPAALWLLQHVALAVPPCCSMGKFPWAASTSCLFGVFFMKSHQHDSSCKWLLRASSWVALQENAASPVLSKKRLHQAHPRGSFPETSPWQHPSIIENGFPQTLPMWQILMDGFPWVPPRTIWMALQPQLTSLPSRGHGYNLSHEVWISVLGRRSVPDVFLPWIMAVSYICYSSIVFCSSLINLLLLQSHVNNYLY